MMNSLNVTLSAIQLTSTTNVEANLVAIAKQLTHITQVNKTSEHHVDSVDGTDITDITDVVKKQHLVVLPECCLYFGGKDHDQLSLAEKSHETNALLVALGKLAKQFGVFLVAGTIPILTAQGNKFTNSCCVFSPEGELLDRYDKIHLFDVAVSDSTQQYCESRYTQAGNKVKVVNTDFANIGLSVCFDLRFPELFSQLAKNGATIITVPSAFTRVTGKAHWQTLLQARAIENQVYIIASGQEGIHENGRETWGHSMIISPWGEVLTCLPQEEGYISVDFQPNEVKRIRQSMPLTSPLL